MSWFSGKNKAVYKSCVRVDRGCNARKRTFPLEISMRYGRIDGPTDRQSNLENRVHATKKVSRGCCSHLRFVVLFVLQICQCVHRTSEPSKDRSQFDPGNDRVSPWWAPNMYWFWFLYIHQQKGPAGRRRTSLMSRWCRTNISEKNWYFLFWGGKKLKNASFSNAF